MRAKVGTHPTFICTATDSPIDARMPRHVHRLTRKSMVIGLLFGTQNGLQSSIVDTADAIYEVDPASGEIVFNQIAIASKIQLCTAVYTTYELLGWYSFAPEITQQHYAAHKFISGFNDAPILLLMNTQVRLGADELPLSVYEVEVHASQQVFVEMAFNLETSRMEKLAIDELTKATHMEGVSPLEVSNRSLQTALGTLLKKLNVLITRLEVMRSSEAPIDHPALRAAAKICNMLPSLDTPQASDDMAAELVDCLMVCYLGSSSKLAADLAHLSDLIN